MKSNKKFKIAIAGAIETHDCGTKLLDTARQLGKIVAKAGHFVVTGSHHGFPQFVAIGAKDANGQTMYFSPAANLKEHEEGYRLDSKNADVIIYTGFGFVGSQIFMTRSSDAVIIGCGKIDALHEFTLAVKEGKPVGVLKGDFKTDEIIKKIVEDNKKSHLPIVFEDDPKRLVEKLIELI